MAIYTLKTLSLLCMCNLGFIWSLALSHELPGPQYRLSGTVDRATALVGQTAYEIDDTTLLSRKKRQGEQVVRDTPPSSTVVEEKTHKYYNSTYFSNARDLYIDMDGELEYSVVTHKALSASHLTAGKVDLPFEFTFYGHTVKRAYLATGGFIYLGPYFHDFLTATQYVAPLMGNFDPSINDTSTIRYANNKTAFTVEWSNVHVSHQQEVGSFTFQTTLMKDGRILFAYKKVPVSADSISGGNGHKVAVGISDGFYIDQPVSRGSTVIERTIYRYHTVNLNKTQVVSNSAFMLTPLVTCNQFTSCNSCISAASVIDFNCNWCSAINHCSSGFDRNRQDWLQASCNTESVEPHQLCPGKSIAKPYKQPSQASGAIIAVVVILVLVVLIAGIVWFVYAYRNPTTNSGLFLIELRHYFKKDSTTSTSNEDRYAVTISGDVQSLGTNGDITENTTEKPQTTSEA